MAEPDHSFVGATLAGGRYHVTAHLGGGGMAEVYLADDQNLPGTRVVIKTPQLALLFAKGSFRERFAREVQALARNNPIHVVPILDAGSHTVGGIERPYLVLRHMAGGSLDDQLGGSPGAREHTQSLTEVLAWARPLAQTLDQLHGQGIIHRDIKPGNLLFDDYGALYLSDFGIVKVLSEIDAPGSGNSFDYYGATLGSPGYMAPEYALRDYGPGYDQYLLATVIYEALAGVLPFSFTTSEEYRILVARDPPRDLGEVRPDLPPGVVAAVMQGLARLSEERHRDCTALIEAIEAGIHMPPEPQPLSDPPPAPSRASGTHHPPAALAGNKPPPRNTRRPWPVLVIALLMVAAAVGYIQYVRPRPLPPAQLAITVTPAAATILVDGQTQGHGSAHLQQTVPASGKTVQVKATAASYQSVERTATLKPGQNQTITLALKPEPAILDISATPASAEITVDGQSQGHGSAHLSLTVPASGRAVTVQAKLAGYQTAKQTLTLTPGQHLSSSLTLQYLAKLRDPLQDGSQGPAMVLIKTGCFEMGSPSSDNEAFDNEHPQHYVCIQHDFYIGQYELTFADYDRFAQATGRDLPDDNGWGRGQRPVINVSLNDALAYTEWLSQQTGQHYRLPTEAEWEYAARAGTTTVYWWGNSIGHDRADCDGCGSQFDKRQTAPVGSFAANPWGLYDTAGNVWEWTCSLYSKSYDGDETYCAKADDPSNRVFRGGSWDDDPRGVRAANRDRVAPDFRGVNLGFRPARSP